MSELIWKPMGAEHSAYITVDRLGAPRCAGGMCVTVRDLARVGQLVLEDGAREGRQVIPPAWIRDIITGGDAKAWAAGSFAKDIFPGLPMRYRSKWYVVDGESPLLFGWGIHGQHLFIDRKRQLVVAKLSSQAQPVDVERMGITLRTVAAIGKSLAG
jgi:CubicO group peptidase (beta-lactamase class C family)